MHNITMQIYRILRKNGSAVDVNIPKEFARALGLSAGIPVLLSKEGDVITLRFLKEAEKEMPINLQVQNTGT